VCICLGIAFCVYLWFRLDYFCFCVVCFCCDRFSFFWVLHHEIGWEERNDHLSWVGRKNFNSVSLKKTNQVIICDSSLGISLWLRSGWHVYWVISVFFCLEGRRATQKRLQKCFPLRIRARLMWKMEWTLCVCVCVYDAGFHVIHSVANILLIYVVLATTAGTRLSVILAFFVNMVCRTFCHKTFLFHIGYFSRPSDHYFCSVCLSVCLCRVFLSRLWSDFDQTRTYVMCLGLVVSPRI